jgi:hypothetical protein
VLEFKDNGVVRRGQPIGVPSMTGEIGLGNSPLLTLRVGSRSMVIASGEKSTPMRLKYETMALAVPLVSALPAWWLSRTVSR